jgi:hypothetical protein
MFFVRKNGVENNDSGLFCKALPKRLGYSNSGVVKQNLLAAVIFVPASW